MMFPKTPTVVTAEYRAESLAPTIIATASLIMGACTVSVLLRYWARYLNRTPMGLEDLVIPLAWLSEIGLCTVNIVMATHAGAGRHFIVVVQEQPESVRLYLVGILTDEFLHLAACALPKLSIVLLYLRIFSNRWERIAAWALLFFVLATWFSFTVATFFQCVPFEYIYNKFLPSGHCFDFVFFSKSSSVPNIFTDLIIMLLPIRTVLNLHVSIGRRIGLLFIFLTGSIGIVASVIRTAVFISTKPYNDPTFKAIPLLNWTVIEPGLYLVAACALSFKPLFRLAAHALHLDKLLPSTRFSSMARYDRKTTLSSARGPNGTFSSSRVRTFESGGTGAFAKMGEGKDGVRGVGLDDEEMAIAADPPRVEIPLSVLVTRTVEVESQSLDLEEEEGGASGGEMRFNVADQDFFHSMLQSLDRRLEA